MNGDWKLTRLGDVLRNVPRPVRLKPENTYRLVGAHWYAKGLYVKEQKSGSEIQAKTLFEVKKGDFVYNRLFAWKGSFAVASKEVDGCFVSNEFPCFAALDAVDPKFLWLYFSRSSAWSEALGLSSGSTPTSRNRLKEEQFLSMAVRLPPIDEQRRIVARIEQLAAKVEAVRALRHETADAAQKLVGVEIQRLFNTPHTGWNSRHLGDYVSDACYGTSEKTTDDPSGTPILRMGNIQNGRLLTRNLKYLHITPKEYPKLVLQKGDILVNRTNSAELVGKCAVFDLDGEFGFASYLIKLRLDTSQALPRLVASYINSPAGRAYMFNERKQMTGQANVNLQKLRALPISLPPLQEQACILAHLDDLESRMDGLKNLQSETAAELDALMPSILSKAFRGEL